MQTYLRGYISFLMIIVVLILASVGYFAYPTITEAERATSSKTKTSQNVIQSAPSTNTIIIHLDTNIVELQKGTTTKTMRIVSQGKPGSYYETIAGVYTSDYKEENHFSSMGHVYMPFSVHLFGNYFIHGIPYYPDGTKVSSAYSGGCVRLNDNDAQYVYNFVTATTTIIITRESKDIFEPTKRASSTLHSLMMTRLMTAFISLEFLTQDDEIYNTTHMTRLEYLPKILTNMTTDASIVYKDKMTTERFVQAMNTRAKTLGLTNTVFIDINTPATTSEEDYGRFMSHILTYKSYLNTAISH